MSTDDDSDLIARARAIPGAGRQTLEGNPLTREEIEMFEMFEREGWSHERCLAFIMAKFEPKSIGDT